MKTYIFDYNGTIIDDVKIAVECENEMLQERGLPCRYTIQQYQEMFTFPMEDYYRSIGYTFEKESFEDVANEFTFLYAKKFSKAGLCEGVIELLEKIRNNHDQCVILSSCHDALLHEQCDQLGICSYFTKIMGIENCLGGSKKDIAKAWFVSSGIKKEDCVYFGDTLADQETAMHIGVDNIILVATGHQSYRRLKEANPLTIHSLKEFNL